MGKFGKWIGGGLGWAFGGPIGALIGFAIGSVLENSNSVFQQQSTKTTTGGFAVTLLVMVAAVMKADGKVMKSELDYVKKYFVSNFGSGAAVEALQILKDLLNQEIPLQDVCRQIKVNLDYSSRLQLLHFMFGISGSDGHVHAKEVSVIEFIASHMGISPGDIGSIKSMFVSDTNASYKILEIDKDASDEDVKKAYRKMAVKYHPDKVSYLGEDFQKAAKNKFQKVNEAFEAIKKERNLV